MINYGKVRSTVKPEAIKIDDYSVWVCSNIESVTEQSGENDEFVGYEYDLIQYDKDEYLLTLAEAATQTEQEAANEAASALVINKLVAEAAQSLDFTEEEYATLALADNIFPEWEEGVTYSAGTRITYTVNSKLRTSDATGPVVYQVTQEVTASSANTPDVDTETYVALSLPSASDDAEESAAAAEEQADDASNTEEQIAELSAKAADLLAQLSTLQSKA